MKIIEKKCPNCHANLEFKVGERDVKCASCRRSFAIEYDRDFTDPEVELMARDVQLQIMEDFKNSRKFAKFFISFVAIVMVAIIIFAVVSAIQQKQEMDQRRQESEAKQEEYRKKQEQAEQEFKDQMDAAEGQFKIDQSEIDKMIEEARDQIESK